MTSMIPLGRRCALAGPVLGSLLVAATAWTAAPASAAPISLTFSEGDFATGDVSLFDVGDTSANPSVLSSGGIGDSPLLRVATAPGSPTELVWGVTLLDAAVWDTSVLGAIDFVDLSVFAKAFAAFGDGQAINVAAQDAGGNLYRSSGTISGRPSTFTERTVTGRGAGNFALIDDANPNFVPSGGSSIQPDFTTGVWTFGFLAGNSGPSAASGTTIDYDDVTITVTGVEQTVSEPGILGLLVLPLAWLGWHRARRGAARPPMSA